MEYELNNNKLRFNKIISDLDKLVFDFIEILNKVGIKYVIISGYVAILFGRSRTTEDIDLFIEVIDQQKFDKFFEELKRHGYWILNEDDAEEAFDILDSSLSLRIAKKGNVIPNFELKFPKKDIDLISLNKPLEIIIKNKKIFISPFEVQIPFKLWLGSDKDLEDAIYIYEIFKDKLNKELMHNISNKLEVSKKMIKYGFK